MKKIIRLTESDLTRIVRRIIKENEEETVDGSQDAYQYIYDTIKSSTTGHKTNGVYFGNNKTPRNILKWNYSGLSVDDKKPFAIELIPNFDKDIPNVKRIGDKKASEALLIIHIQSKGNNTQGKFDSISNYLSASEKFYDYGHEGYKTKVYIIDKSNVNNAIKVINNLTKK